MNVTRRGIWIFPNRPAGELVDAIVAADELGLDEVWLADEGAARTPFAVLGAAAVRTERVSLATGITSPVLRHPGALAASIATVDELSGGRAVLGLGVGGALSLEPFGLTADRPVTVLRDSIATARSVLERRSTPNYRLPDHAIPARGVPIWIGARGPQLVGIGATHADGLFVSGCTSDQVDDIAGRVAATGGAQLAVYQSAHERPTRPSEHAWDTVAALLADEGRRVNAASIGINLTDAIADTDRSLVTLVERAAAVLADT